MEPTAFDSDDILTDFLTDYLDGNLSAPERKSFEAYLAQNKKEKIFVRKAMKGKKALARLAKHIDVPSVTA
ncbi:hypothetical protein [Fodinibius halophilus]|uniref:Anti-sigma factor n=1 Tax=Fodinibius halophilus TaxID=1736908 RepID=A0A6M1TDK8_9BACT|nr:hypothetical protein [Fodinibius halophilus]NGP88904.1 hypothetical protein [Fodinibius halophilus]